MSDFRAGTIGLLGLPNAGKSTLVNALVGEKVAIISEKPQTTRQRVMGFYTDDRSQQVFVDAPGLVRSERGLNHFLQVEAEDIFRQVDVVLVVIALDTGREEQVDEILQMAASLKRPWACVISKCDLACVHRIPKIEEKVKALGVPVWSLSVERNTKEVQRLLRNEISQLLPPSDGPLYDTEIFTTQNMRDLACELIREQCFLLLQHEIPYGLAVRMVSFKEQGQKMPVIHAEIVLSKESHKPIVIGQQGRRLKKIGTLARKNIESMMQSKVYLDLHVTVKPKWAENKKFMKEMGYVLQN